MSRSATSPGAGLATQCRLGNPDRTYQLLTDACQDLDAATGHLLHAQLVLLLMNHIGDDDVLQEAIQIARQGLKRLAVTPSHSPRAHIEGARS
ncbi:DUF2783 domain-containing protein [Pseudomonas japonica]|uniref:DUF2783 domain-containing protein n=1 Tax=Pseudomonas japonica TaxID=256466 RepID=A0A239GGK7_9PSED|nr:DUF2783 domain-containing protein [Pseudomonas japonica]SNS67878.1 Protein of unknown function [Pseudomonas japonica]